MTALASFIALLLHAALMPLAAVALAGVLGWLRARLQGRAGPPVLQPWRDLRRLARKQPVLPDASPLLAAAPMASLAATGAAALLVPSFTLGMASAPLADLIVLAGLLALSRWAMALAGLDAGAASGGMAAGRAMSLATLSEPALLLVVFAVAGAAGSTNLDAVAASVRDDGAGLRVASGLALLAAAIVALAESGRLPVADPGAAGELLPGPDAAALAFSGWHLALLEAAAALRLLAWLSLLVALFLPAGIAPAGSGPLAWAAGLAAWVAKLAVMAVALALFEARRPTMRRARLPELLGAAVLLGLLAAAFLFVGERLA